MKALNYGQKVQMCNGPKTCGGKIIDVIQWFHLAEAYTCPALLNL
jgi:hypothetical protein